MKDTFISYKKKFPQKSKFLTEMLFSHSWVLCLDPGAEHGWIQGVGRSWISTNPALDEKLYNQLTDNQVLIIEMNLAMSVVNI